MSALRSVLAAILPLMAAAAMLYIGNGLLGTVLALRLDIAGVSASHIGLIMASWALGFIIGTVLCPMLVDRVGHIRCYAAFAAITASSVLGHGLTDSIPVWMVLRLIYGAAMASLLIVVESWLNAKSDNQIRGQVMSAYMIIYYLASAVGQVILTFSDPSGIAVICQISITIALSLVPLALGRVEQPPPIPAARLSPRALWAISPASVVVAFCSGLLIGGYNGFMPVYARWIDDDITWVAQLVIAGQVGGLILQFPIGRLSDIFDRRQVMAGLTAAAAVVCVVTVAIGGLGGVVSMVLVALLAGFSFALYPMALSYANDHMQPHQIVSGSAGLQLCFGIGAILGPLGIGPLISLVGPVGLPGASAGIAALLLVFILYRMSRRRAVPLDEQASYVATVPTTAAVAELDPRYEPEEEQLAFDF